MAPRTPTRKSTKRGPRPGEIDRAPERLLAEARKLAPEELTIRRVAKEARYTPRVPMYLFGSLAGLHAAVALEGFNALNAHLAEAARQAEPAGDGLKALAIAYLGFGLAQLGMRWRTMHSRELWVAMQDERENQSVTRSRWLKQHLGLAEDGNFFVAIESSRQEALALFMAAARSSGKPEPAELVRTLTALVDGLLWQTHFENVHPDLPRYARMIDHVIAGWN